MSNLFYILIFLFLFGIGWSFLSKFVGFAIQIVFLIILIGVAFWVFRQAVIS